MSASRSWLGPVSQCLAAIFAAELSGAGDWSDDGVESWACAGAENKAPTRTTAVRNK
ncbi:hypothetical protein AA0535_2143 [Asaia krungthepensis NRIC 0535]|uniref:Secreted protein n=1 Tax=Asaia krungthepensis NRIC 0535 TaxID=1307925 RepID=A0ABQ0Q4C7_9PROT|nr:hypothetical protein AA0535_2143 [Asaia krungthepensis NRIC 0535]